MDQIVEKKSAAAEAVTFTRVGSALGANVTGIDLTQPMDADTQKVIHDGLAEHELLRFPDQDISSDDLIRFGESFGELSVHPFSPNDEDVPVLIRFENTADNPPWGTDVWHSDETFRVAPPMATALVAKEVPAVGGDTMYASMTAAYEGLSDKMQTYISGLEGIHDFKPFKRLFGDSEEDRKNLQEYEMRYPPAVHPVVRIHPVTGRKSLFVNPQFTIAIKGMGERESRNLLDILFHQALVPEYQYRHQWQPHTLAFWDNRSAQHYAIHDYYPQRRIMERVTISGDRPVGEPAAAPETVTRPRYTTAPEGANTTGGHSVKRQFQREIDG